MRTPSFLGLLAIALALVALAGCGGGGGSEPRATTSGQARAQSTDFIGIYADDVYFGDEAYRRAALARQQKAGVQLIRQPFSWTDAVRDPQRFDDFVGAAAEAKIRVLPVMVGPEPGVDTKGGMKPPSDPERYAGWVATVVQRYGPKGSFWSDHPDIPKLPITSWQVWNEPNITAWWAPQPDPVAYAKLLNATGSAIHKVDPNAEIVAAGLPTSHLGTPAPDYLAAALKAGASFDTAAVHPYASTPAAVVDRVKAIQDVVGPKKKVWVTEVGWGTGGKPGPLTVTEDQQASYIKETITRLRDMNVRGVVVFQWHDPKPYAGRREIWPFYAGLLRADGEPKPSFAAFEEAASAGS